jgi:hypothetical protein
VPVTINDPFTCTGAIPIGSQNRLVIQLSPAANVVFDRSAFRARVRE